MDSEKMVEMIKYRGLNEYLVMARFMYFMEALLQIGDYEELWTK